MAAVPPPQPPPVDPGVEAEVARLFRSHHGRLLRLAQILVDDRGAAEEVVQEAFVRLFRQWGSLREPDAAAGWLRTTVLNLARSRLRRRGLARARREAVPVAPASPAERAELNEEHRQVVEAVRALPRRQREVVVLRFYEDLSVDETAAALGISAGAVKTHTHRGMAALALKLEER